MRNSSRTVSGAMAVIVSGSLLLISTAAVADQPSPSSSSDPAPPLDFDTQPGEGTALAPGSYVTSAVPPLLITFSVPSGWYKGDVPFAVWNEASNSSVAFHSPDNVFADACNPDAGQHEPPIGPTVDDLVAALQGMRGVTASAPIEETLSGYAGKRVDLIADPAAGCDENALWDFAGFRVPGPGSHDQLQILDVDGTRLVVLSRGREGVSEVVQAQHEQIVNSVQFARVAPDASTVA
jgi:hypothetical protein